MRFFSSEGIILGSKRIKLGSEEVASGFYGDCDFVWSFF
jgi:hypothetical protein